MAVISLRLVKPVAGVVVRERAFATTTALRSALVGVAQKELDAMKAAGTYKTERVISSPQGSHVQLAAAGKSVINFCANNYIGFASHPEVVEAVVSHPLATLRGLPTPTCR
jgi:7-keto-8-aminopelargonate synthetase-like enzyme